MMQRIDSRSHLQDKLLTCCDCGADFLFTIGEQIFFASKQLSEPKRCKACRQVRRQTLVPDQGAGR